MAFYCYKCGEEYTEKPKPGFKDVCEHCSAYLYSCMSCEHYELERNLGCRLTYVEIVADPAKYNFCDEFKFREGKAQSAGKLRQSLFDGPVEPKKNIFEDGFKPEKPEKDLFDVFGGEDSGE